MVETKKETWRGGRVSYSLGYDPGSWFVYDSVVYFERIEKRWCLLLMKYACLRDLVYPLARALCPAISPSSLNCIGRRKAAEHRSWFPCSKGLLFTRQLVPQSLRSERHYILTKSQGDVDPPHSSSEDSPAQSRKYMRAGPHMTFAEYHQSL